MAVEHPSAWIGAKHFHIHRLSWSDVLGIDHQRIGQGIAVELHHFELVAVQVHGMVGLTRVDHPNEDALPGFDLEKRVLQRLGKGVAVDGVPPCGLMQQQRILPVVLGQPFTRLHDERPEQALGQLFKDIRVGVIHPGPRFRSDKLIGPRSAGFNVWLRYPRDPVLVVGDLQTVPMDGRGLGQVVGEVDPDLVALLDPDLGARVLAIVAPDLNELSV